MQSKTCRKCGEEKAVGDFIANTRYKGGLMHHCRACMAAVAKKWDADNPDRKRVRARKAQLARYGLTVADYDRMLAEQGGGCAICGSTEGGRGDAHLVVDHDHTTGKVRGLLCHACNTGIGLFNDSASLTLSATQYLNEHDTTTD